MLFLLAKSSTMMFIYAEYWVGYGLEWTRKTGKQHDFPIWQIVPLNNPNLPEKYWKYTINRVNGDTFYCSWKFLINIHSFTQIGILPLERGHEVVDLGACFDAKLSFREHRPIHAKINKAYIILGTIKHNFKYLTVPTFVLIYNSMVRSHLD